ncbi:MAG TPA: FlgD immunoglobulin-like domain containing protein [Candidatus Syntrophosphaera sp.]|nr:FlgD immunoglobulin-like domain containing protein [Candidatus Syntrophosphaera sp.]
MKHTAMLLLLLAVSLAFANPVWTEDVVVREAQDLSYTGCTQQADDGSLITLWTQILDGENCLMANRISALGEEMWDSSLRIAGCGLGIGGEQMVRCSDDSYLVCWLEGQEELGSGHARLMANKIDLQGNLLWTDGGVLINNDCYFRFGATVTHYLIRAHSSGGAYILVQPEPNLPAAYAYKLNGSGNDTWSLIQPLIQAEQQLTLNDCLASFDDTDGLVVSYHATSQAGTNYNLATFNYLNGSIRYHRSFPLEPGEVGPHELFLEGYYCFFDAVMIAQTDTRLRFRLFRFDLEPYIEQPEDLVLNPQPMPLSTHFKLEKTASLYYRVLSSTPIDGVTQVRTHTYLWSHHQYYPTQIWSGTGEVSYLDWRFDDSMKAMLIWSTNSGPDTPLILRGQAIDNSSGEPVWPADGLVISENWDSGCKPQVFGWNTNPMYLLVEKGSGGKSLRFLMRDYGGNPLQPAADPLSEALAGSAIPIASLAVNGHNVLIYNDSRHSGGNWLYFQILSTDGELLLPSGGIPIGSYGPNIRLLGAINYSSDRFAVLYTDTNTYLQIFDLVGNPQWAGNGLLVCPGAPYAGYAKFCEHEGDIYLGWLIDYGTGTSQLYGQRISNLQKMWGEPGRLLLEWIPNPNVRMVNTPGRYFAWFQRRSGSNNFCTYCLLVDANGDLLPGWNPQGTKIFEAEASPNVWPIYSSLVGEDLVCLIAGYPSAPIFAQRVTPQASFPWTEAGVLVHEPPHLTVGCAIDDNTLNLIYDHTEGSGTRSIRLQRVILNGGNLGYPSPGLQLNTSTPLELGKVSLARLECDALLGVWSEQSNYQDDGRDLYYRLIDPENELVGDSQSSFGSHQGDADNPRISTFGDEAIVCWSDERTGIPAVGHLQTGIYAQKLAYLSSSLPQEPDTPSAGLAFVNCYPNPFRGSVQVNWSTKAAQPAELLICNIHGQVVKRFRYMLLQSGEHSLYWDGNDEQGRQVSSGVYLLRLRSGNESRTVKILRW